MLCWRKQVYQAWHLVDLPLHLINAAVSGHGHAALWIALRAAAKGHSLPLLSLWSHQHLGIRVLMLETSFSEPFSIIILWLWERMGKGGGTKDLPLQQWHGFTPDYSARLVTNWWCMSPSPAQACAHKRSLLSWLSDAYRCMNSCLLNRNQAKKRRASPRQSPHLQPALKALHLCLKHDYLLHFFLVILLPWLLLLLSLCSFQVSSWFSMLLDDIAKDRGGFDQTH